MDANIYVAGMIISWIAFSVLRIATAKHPDTSDVFYSALLATIWPVALIGVLAYIGIVLYRKDKP